jgi:DNA-binding TFAR19-related protein (PDSD5 family)
MNSDYEEIRRQIEEQEKISQEIEQQIAIMEQLAKKFMSKEAIARYGALKISHLETAIKAIALIAQAVSEGKIREKISDAEFREILKAIQEKKEFRFRR